ncbi:hypothetical protein NLJ89_g10637 [Agrocybe chaxingu]|uniref:Uncharacterized protein n=1 Tax=Agrocybe chaxingu TaxID=84603 RepID=A0A9W8JQ76_9AGAR|nr:hypothetical protein NLJ89_g10637 [Agrocybe chaxingu]
MPARAPSRRCTCPSCLAEGEVDEHGVRIGKLWTPAEFIVHRHRVAMEARASASVQPDVIAAPPPPSIPPPHTTSLSELPADDSVHQLPSHQSPPFKSSKESQSKGKNRRRTQKAHRVLNNIETRCLTSLEILNRVEGEEHPSRQIIADIENELAILRRGFDAVKLTISSVKTRKEQFGPVLARLESRSQMLKQRHYVANDGPLQYSSDHYFNPPINAYHAVAQISMLVVVILELLQWAFAVVSDKVMLTQKSIISQIPRTLGAVLDKFNLSPKTTTYAEDPPAFITSVFDADFIRNFKGPGGTLFVDRPQNEGRYLFAFNVDFFSSECQTVRGASASSGIISAVCLNLPESIRYKKENMYIAGIISGLDEPHLTQLNHYMRPIVDDLLVSYKKGVHYSCTANHPTGKTTRSALSISVNDLPAARKVNIEDTDWLPKNPALQRQKAEHWRNAESSSAQEKLFSENGLRWSELWRLPYWDPANMLVVDPMHCLLEGLAQYHFHEVLKLTETAANAKVDIPDAFEYAFPLPTDLDAEKYKFGANDLKHIPQIQKLLISPIESTDGSVEPNFAQLQRGLEYKNWTALRFVSDTVRAQPLDTQRRKPTPPDHVFSKAQYVAALVLWRSQRPLTRDNQLPSIVTPAVMNRIRDVIRDTDTPSWLESVPYNFGMASAGTLKADEWRTMTTVYLPISLISMWGEGMAPTARNSAILQRVLDHTMHLVCAISLACKRTMTRERREAYLAHLLIWMRSLSDIRPGAQPRPNHHLAIHIYDFLYLFGPVRSWWCFAFERLIGQLQRLPHNHKFGQLEATMLSVYSKMANLRHWLARPESPEFRKRCKAIFDKAFNMLSENDFEDDLLPDTAFGPVPPLLRSIVSDKKVALRARYKSNGVVFSRHRRADVAFGSIEHIITRQDGID